MQKLLKSIKENRERAAFLLPSLPTTVTGKIAQLTTTKIVIETQLGDDVFQYVTHPNNIVLVYRKP